MRLKTFTAPTMQQALRIIKNDLGSDAVILSTKKIKGQNGEISLEITAALDDSAEMVSLSPSTVKQPAFKAVSSKGGNLASALTTHNLPEDYKQKLLKAVEGVSHAGFSAEDALDMVLGKMVDFTSPASLVSRGQAHVFMGPTGAGKTTLISKLAVERKKNGNSIGLMSFDDQKIAGFEPLDMVAEALGEKAHLISSSEDLVKAAEGLGKRHYLFIDTPGLNPLRPEKMKAFKEKLDMLGVPLTVHLVIPAHLNGEDMAAIPYAFRMFNPVSMIFTKLDETSRIGPVAGTMIEQSLAVGMVCNGPEVESSPDIIDSATLARKLATTPKPIWEAAR